MKKNTIYMFSLHVFSMLYPFMLFFYAAKKISPSLFGELMLCVAIAQYYQVFVDYGFNVSATAKVSLLEGSNDKGLFVLVVNVLLSKMLLFSSFFPIVVLVLVFLKIGIFSGLIIILGVFASIFCMQWLWMGSSNFMSWSIIGVVSRLLGLLVISCMPFVSLEWFLFLYFFNTFVVAAYCVFSVFRRNTREVMDFEFNSVLCLLKEGGGVFIASFGTSLYLMLTPVLLGYHVNRELVGFYSLADKVRQAAQGVLGQITMVIYPYIVKNNKVQDEEKVNKYLKSIFSMLIFVAVVFSVIIYFLSSQIVFLYFNKIYEPAVGIMRLMSLIIPFSVLAGAISLLYLIPKGKSGQLAKIVVCAGILSVLVLILTVDVYGILSGFLAVLSAEMFILLSFMLMLMRKRNGV